MSPRAESDFLVDPACYLFELTRLGERAFKRGTAHRMRQWDATPAELWVHRERLARALAREVGRGRYRLGAVESQRLAIAGRERTLHRFAWIDHVVVAVLARGLSRLAEPLLFDGLHSYRRGRSAASAVSQLTDYLARHRADRPRRERGLFVLRRDVRAYGEHIRTGDDSHLWPALRPVLEGVPARLRGLARDLVTQALRPAILRSDGSEARMTLGTPTGSPLQPLINNLYLTATDHRLGELPGGLFVRFGDDMLFAHPRSQVARAASAELERDLSALGLSCSEDKRADLYLTHCGRPSVTWPEVRGGPAVAYLGFRIGFDGTTSLKPHRVRALMLELRRRWDNTDGVAAGLGHAERQALLCGVTSEALDPRGVLAASAAGQLLSAVSDRHQLQQLDYRIALALAQRLSGRRGVRAFRDVSHRALRDAGLVSLVLSRNRGVRPLSASHGHATRSRGTDSA